MTEAVLPFPKLRKAEDRSCGPCTACCDGWLHGEAYGHSFYKGKPCHFIGCNGCSIYENRPKSPCKDYLCQWRKDVRLPEWLQPHLSGIIITERPFKDNRTFLEVIETTGPIRAEVLNWIVLFALNNKLNLRYQVNGGWNRISFDQEFLSDPNY